MLAHSFVMVKTKSDLGQVPSWTIFLILHEESHADFNRSVDLYSLTILQNTYSMYGYYFCNIVPMLAQALVLVEMK